MPSPSDLSSPLSSYGRPQGGRVLCHLESPGLPTTKRYTRNLYEDGLRDTGQEKVFRIVVGPRRVVGPLTRPSVVLGVNYLLF